jgi:uncharacterized ferritin-like protein (DUF455 family)
MELREFAERILFAKTLQEKLQSPILITDQQPGRALDTPETPGRPPELRFKPRYTGKASVPSVHSLDQPSERGRLLHFFANHELLATELMALVLLRFPDAPSAFRRAVLQTLKDEQQHTRWYLTRMHECGINFGELPVSGYFWRSISNMESPLDYVAGLSLTFEQANLDFARFFARGFARVGDTQSSQLLERIYHDEIAHVACGLKWFRTWKSPQQSDWDAFRQQLKFPLSAQRAKGPVFNIDGRLAAGLDREFIDELSVFAQSKGRTPGIFVFNPFAEGRIAEGKTFTLNKHQQLLQRDLENLPQFLCRQDDVVLVRQRPSAAFQCELKKAGYTVPEFVELGAEGIDAASSLHDRKLGRLRPWAWGPDSLELLRPLIPNVTTGSRNPDFYHHNNLIQLYSKEWSVLLLRKVLQQHNEASLHPWLCTEHEIGMAAATVPEVLTQIDSIRRRGHHRVIVKQTLGVAGHNAIRLLEPKMTASQLRWITHTLENGQRLVVEPWLERKSDFSVQLEMQTSGLKLLGYTGLTNDWRGQYQGNWALPSFNRHICINLVRVFPRVPDIERRVQRLYSEIVFNLQGELRRLGYFGPIGIDAFVYESSDGECRLKPIVELNPRYTMGRLTLELMRNVAPGSRGALRLITQKMVRSHGFDTFSALARTVSEQSPVRLEGEPVSKIREGAVCLNDPERARVCLAMFQVDPQTS